MNSPFGFIVNACYFTITGATIAFLLVGKKYPVRVTLGYVLRSFEQGITET